MGVVAYTVFDGPKAQRGVWTIHTDGSHRRRIAESGVQPRWSPDGSRLMHSSGGRLVVVNADGTHPQVLVSRRVSSAAWAPDGTQVAFARWDRDYAEHLVVLDLATGTRTRVPETAEGFYAPDGRYGLDWSPDGTRLTFVAGTGEEYDDYSNVTALFTIDLDGTDLARLTGRSQVMGPRWSPDGTRVLYAMTYLGRDGSDDRYGIELRSVVADGTGDVSVLDRGWGTGPGDWSPDADWVVSSSAPGGMGPFFGALEGLWLVRPDGTGAQFMSRFGVWPDWGPQVVDPAPVPHGVPPGGSGPLALSTASEAGIDLSMVAPDGRVSQVTSDGTSEAPALSPNGDTLRFFRGDWWEYSAWAMDLASGIQTQLRARIRGDFYGGLAVWAPHGKRLAFPNYGSVVVLTLASGERVRLRLAHDGWDNFDDATWSADGRWIAITAERHNRPTERPIEYGIFILHPDGTGLRLVYTTSARHELSQPDFSPDGQWIAFTQATGPSYYASSDVWVVRRDASAAHPVLATPGYDWAPAWAPGGRRLAVASDGSHPFGPAPSPGVWVVRRNGTNPHLVLPLRGIVDLDW